MAKSPLHRKTDKLLDEHEKLIGAAFLAGIAEIRSKIILKQIVERLRAYDIVGAIAAMNIERAAFGKLEIALLQVYLDGGALMANNLPFIEDADNNRVTSRFDMQSPGAKQWIDDHSAGLVALIVDSQEKIARSAFEAQFDNDNQSYAAVIALIGTIKPFGRERIGGLLGLTSVQAENAQTALTELLSGDTALMKNYLTREQRDKRFDSVVRAAIGSGSAISIGIAKVIIGRYVDGMRNLRADTIGKTEALVVVNSARSKALEQALEKTNYSLDRVTKRWSTVGDARVRNTHMLMNGQTVTGMNTPFASPAGGLLLYPGDMSFGAGPGEIINCRCWVSYGVDGVDDERL